MYIYHIGLRTKKIGLCTNSHFTKTMPYRGWASESHNRQNMLVLPTGIPFIYIITLCILYIINYINAVI
jgi:hypothetical protein